MNEKIKILLNEERNIDSVNVDSFSKINLQNKPALINEYNIRNVLSVTELFELEREENEIYRIYGKIEYMSLLNGLRNNYDEFRDFFNPLSSTLQRRGSSNVITPFKNIFNSFDFYLVRPSDTEYIQNVHDSNLYFRPFKVIASTNNIELYNAGFANNVYNEQTYAFHFNIDFDVSEYRDFFGFPLTELFLFILYKPSENETIQHRRFEVNGQISYRDYVAKTLEIGDFVESFVGNRIGDYINYSKKEFKQTQIHPQEIRIMTPIPSYHIRWKYNPFIPLRLRYFDNYVSRANLDNKSYDVTDNIPNYATNIGNNNFVWREILPQGYIDQLTGVGVNYPFVNKRRYLFDRIILDIVPDLSHGQTHDLFQSLSFDNDSTLLNTRPINDINEIGKPCL